GGRDAKPDEERRYIAEMKKTHYAFLDDRAVTLAEANHQRYGVSTTPTLVVIDRAGVVRSYHPGNLGEPELETLIQPLLAQRTPATR
ncbi:MAG: TlpA family protein disulfide reductase, partial [Vicinamibacterales bacterium]